VLRRAIDNWYSRHRHPVSFWLHMVGIPACFVAAPVLLVVEHWWGAAGSFVGGYVLQFAGHAIEGNRSGEELLVRRLLKKQLRDSKSE
jgi:uncharacterized membrane protein YGL010W